MQLSEIRNIRHNRKDFRDFSRKTSFEGIHRHCQGRNRPIKIKNNLMVYEYFRKCETVIIHFLGCVYENRILISS